VPKENKRYKSAPGTILNLGKRISELIKIIKPKYVHLIFKVTIRHNLKAFINELIFHRINVDFIETRIPHVFSHVRQKKKRRV
jgi:hypothetical protein